MADQTVGELIRAQDIGPTDLFVLEQSGVAKSLTGQILINWMTRYADGHGGIQKIEKTKTQGLVDTYRITMADTTTFDFPVTNGKSITGIEKTGTHGLVDTYTISYNSGDSTTFTVTNGAKGDKGDNVYLWIKYASQKPSDESHSMGDVPDNWIGVYAGTKSSAPSEWNEYNWFQWKGNKGDTGTPSTLVSSKTEYQLSGNGTAPPSGSWSASIPVVPQGSFLWTRTTQQYNTGSPVVSYSVARFGIDGKGSVSSVCQKSPNPDGNVEIGAADVDALPITGGDMQGEIDMRSYSLTGLGDASRDGDAVSLKFARGNFAPAAYGLGVSATQISGWNLALKNGFYKSSNNTPDGDGNYWNGIVCNYSDALAFQLVWKTRGDSVIMATRKITNTTHEEWEYINPPMVKGVQYRTTERYGGEPVYTILIDGGAIPYNSSKTVSYGVNTKSIVRFAANFESGTFPRFSGADASPILTASAWQRDFQVITTGMSGSMSGKIMAQLWYTRG